MNKWILTGVVAFASISICAYAAKDKSAPKSAKAGGPYAEIMAKYDASKDGKLDDAEKAAMNDKAKNAPKNRPDGPGPTGGMTPDVTGAETYGTIITVSESPKLPGLLWVGTDDGLVHITRDNTKTWQNAFGHRYLPMNWRQEAG